MSEVSLSETMTALMDKAREITGITEKISVARLTSLMNHFDLHVNPNLLSSTTVEVASNQSSPYPMWVNQIVYSKLKPKTTYTLSLSATNTNGVKGASARIYCTNWNGRYINKQFQQFFFDADGKKKVFTFTTPEFEGWLYDVYLYAGSMSVDEHKDFVTTYKDCKLEVGDLATPLQKVGGVVKAVLSALHLERRCLA